MLYAFYLWNDSDDDMDLIVLLWELSEIFLLKHLNQWLIQ